MSRFPLILHSQCRSPVATIDAAVRRAAPGMIHLTYHLSGALNETRIPAHRPSSRADELWKHTCFEAFIGAADGYYEFNVAPSSQWAAYRFGAYRQGMRDAPMPDPAVMWHVGEDRAELTATLHLPPDATGPLGLSAVIEDKDGGRSYWALAHAPGPPDFHNAACFTAQLPPAG